MRKGNKRGKINAHMVDVDEKDDLSSNPGEDSDCDQDNEINKFIVDTGATEHLSNA